MKSWIVKVGVPEMVMRDIEATRTLVTDTATKRGDYVHHEYRDAKLEDLLAAIDTLDHRQMREVVQFIWNRKLGS